MKLLREVTREHDLNEIILEERKMVTGVLVLGGGHWYKCPNGHYCCVVKSQINQEPLCPECKTSIAIRQLAAVNQDTVHFNNSQFVTYTTLICDNFHSEPGCSCFYLNEQRIALAERDAA